ncbi:Alpha/Beta hydrolase protein [Ochromonadaceae sp. CCMP2298]|nr:Alpha/Beta hydrolase protein [Ochromonadaceae sp. CCMP2298]|mmetsp:Transcript_15621/g.34524  ORF Transcript_15621/g.34524 Transcript_15621/m.34524 type:complete len:377 (+) Transcript_15621:99-1229(+)
MVPVLVILGALGFIASASSAPSATTVLVEAQYPTDLGALFLRGSDCGLSWDKGLLMDKSKATEGYTYSLSVSCSATATQPLEVKVLIADDRWMLGANHFIPQHSNGTALYPWFFTYSGSLSTISNVYSKELNNFRDIIYYTPPSYSENTLKRYKNLLVMHDGQNLFNPQTSAFGTAWMCQNTMDDLIIQGKSEEVVIAGAYNTASRVDEYTYIYDPSEGAGGEGDLYLDWLESTLLPLTQLNYRVEIQRETLGILGSSLGGLISCYAGWTRNVYGKVGCMSSSFWWDDGDFQKHVMLQQDPAVAGQSLPHIYMDSGTAEPPSTTVYVNQIYDYCLQDGFSTEEVCRYLDQGGSHSESSWGPRFHIPIEYLYPAGSA